MGSGGLIARRSKQAKKMSIDQRLWELVRAEFRDESCAPFLFPLRERSAVASRSKVDVWHWGQRVRIAKYKTVAIAAA